MEKTNQLTNARQDPASQEQKMNRSVSRRMIKKEREKAVICASPLFERLQ